MVMIFRNKFKDLYDAEKKLNNKLASELDALMLDRDHWQNDFYSVSKDLNECVDYIKDLQLKYDELLIEKSINQPVDTVHSGKLFVQQTQPNRTQSYPDFVWR